MDIPKKCNEGEFELDEKADCSGTQDFTTSSSIKETLENFPEVLSFIERLQECIIRQRSLIHKLYSRLKEEGSLNKTLKDEFTQTNEDDIKICSSSDKTTNLIEDIKEAAENAVQQTGFVYESTSGMYYDYNTGYYYNAELGLYYDGNSGTYYYFDDSANSFQFHSQVSIIKSNHIESNDVVTTEDVPKTNKRTCNILQTADVIPKKIKTEIKEEGECSDSESENEIDICQVEYVNLPNSLSTNQRCTEVEDCTVRTIVTQNDYPDDEVAKAWPPCLRVVVKETELHNLPVGSLSIVTCTGGSLGRVADHAIFIPDINISKHHAKIGFSEEDKCYKIVDLGSRNGTFVDGKRISVALQESEPMDLHHGTEIKVGSTILVCHLHVGRETCENCEPGCTLNKQSAESKNLTDKDHETKEARHRSELRKLRKRFGLDKMTMKEAKPSLAMGYQDRAEERRKTVGSLDHNAKTETSSVDQSIKSTNKGFKMLSKMGWSQGQSLGKDSTTGITEPVLVEQRPDKAGLGSDVVHHPPPDPKTKRKAEVWKKAQERFQQLDDV